MPSGYADLLGHTATMERLVRAADRQELHHCYLFEGPPRVGKHTAAIRLAMAAACTGEGIRPCGRCALCNQFDKRTHPDLIEIVPDPGRKSGTISVAQVRELIRQVRLRPYGARRRTVVIDPVDMLVPQAANALLKTLEEPPPGTGFILITSRSSALLPTVLSRSQRVRFSAAREDVLVPWLVERKVPDPERCARLSMGCPGAALELGSGGLKKLDAVRDHVVELVEGGTRFRLGELEKVGKRKDPKGEALARIAALETLLRDCVAFSCAGGDRLLNADRPDVVSRWAVRLWPRGIERLQEQIDLSRQRMEVNVNPRLMMEALFAHVDRELAA